MFKRLVLSYLTVSMVPAYGMGLTKITGFARYAKTIAGGVLGNFAYTTYKYAAKAEEKQLTEFEKFTQKFAPPKEIQETIEQNKHNIDYSKKVQVIRGSQPPVILKRIDPDPREAELPLYRIINAERMRKVIEENKLTTLSVPKKYIYKLGDSWEVFTEAADTLKGKIPNGQLTAEEFKEIALLAKETCYKDWNYTNLRRNKSNGKLVVIDTEGRSFGGPGTRKLDCISDICFGDRFRGLRNKEAQDWCHDHWEHIKTTDDGHAVCTSLPYSTKYDDLDIDFEKARYEFERTKKYKELLDLFDKKCIDHHLDNIIACNDIARDLEKLTHQLATKHGVYVSDRIGKRKESAG